MTTKTYKDNFTLDGRLRPGLGVTPKKVAAVKELFEARNSGDFMADAKLKEALTTSDAIFNFAHFANINFLPNYDDAPRVWRDIAGVRETPDLKPVTLYSLNRSWSNGDGESSVLGGGNPNVAPVIPEGTPYPYAYISGENAQGAGMLKRGFKTDWTLESRINDGVGALDTLPDEMLSVALDTEEEDVFGALLRDGKAHPLAGGALPDGVSVPVNAGLSRRSIFRAIIELEERKINGRNLRVRGGYNVIVPVGVKRFIEWELGLTEAQVKDGNLVLNVNGANPVGDVTVIESESLTGLEWFLLPKTGATRRPVLERLELRGYRTPQLFVDNHVGTYVGGASVSPFEGSFDADVITLKLRMFGGGVVWDDGIAIVYSNGTGV